MIKAHGVTYTSVEQARERIADLEAKNARIGASDGRVTEINAIKDALAEHLIANPPKVRYATYTLVEREAFTAPAPKAAPAVEQPAPAEEKAPRETVVVEDEDGRWTVVKQSYGTGCHHPSCAILHRHLAKEPYFDGGWHEEWATHNGRDVQVRVNRWHEKTVTEWIVLRDGERVGDAHDTKREALRQAEQKPTH